MPVILKTSQVGMLKPSNHAEFKRVFLIPKSKKHTSEKHLTIASIKGNSLR